MNSFGTAEFPDHVDRLNKDGADIINLMARYDRSPKNDRESHFNLDSQDAHRQAHGNYHGIN